MKIKQKLPDDVVVSKFKHLQKVALLPKMKIGDYTESDWILAYLLTSLDSFDKEIFLARKELGIKKTFRYSSVKKDFGELIKSLYSLGQDKYIISIDIAKNIIKKFRLGENWLTSIQTAIFTDTLPVPEKNEPIQIETQDNFINRGFDYCSIRINQRITTNELKKWIKKNKLWIRHNLNNLPKINKPKIDPNTVLWGHFAWILKKAGMISWTEMSKFIEKSTGKIGFVKDIESSPGPEELERYYKRFIASLKKIDQ